MTPRAAEQKEWAAPGFPHAEGIVVFHVAGGYLFKKTLGDDGHKGDAVDEAGA